MTGGDTQRVIDRLDELAAASLQGVEVPVIDVRLPRRRRWKGWGALAAAAAIVAVIAGLVVARNDGSDVRTVDGPETTVLPDGPYLMPTEWPEGLAGEVVTADPSGGSSTQLADTWLLALDGHAAAIAVVMNLPPGSGSAADPAEGRESIVIDGREATYTSSAAGETVSVALDPAGAVSVTSQVVPRSTLEPLAASVAQALIDDAALEAAALLEGWTVMDDEAGIGQFFVTGGIPASSWSVARRDSGTANVSSQMFVGGRHVEDPAAAVADVASVFPDAESVDVGGEAAGLLRTIPGLDAITVIWAPDDHTLATVSGMYLSREQVLAAARSVREIGQEEWANSTPATSPTHVVNGVPVPKGEQVVGSGRAEDVRWVLTTADVDSSAEAAPPETYVMTSLYLRDGDGQTSGGGSGGSGRMLGVAMSPYGAHAVLWSDGAPIGLADATLWVGGDPVAAIAVDVPKTQRTYVFAILPLETVPSFDEASSRVTGVLPDGVPYDSRSWPG